MRKSVDVLGKEEGGMGRLYFQKKTSNVNLAPVCVRDAR